MLNKILVFVFCLFFGFILLANDLKKDNFKIILSIKKKPSKITRKTRGLFTFKTTGKHAYYQCKFDDKQWKICPNPKYFNNLNEGEHIFIVRALNKEKKIISNEVVFKWFIDKTPPKTKLLVFPKKFSNKKNSVFEFESTEKNVSFECKIDFQKWKICKNKISLFLTDGQHIFKVKSRDNAGNIERKFIKYVWNIDSKSPIVKFDKKNNNLINKSFNRFYFFANESALFKCKLDKNNWKKCKTGVKISNLADGNHSFFVKATDKSNNDSKIAEFRFTVDKTAPKIDFDRTPKVLTNKKRAEFVLKTSEECLFVSQIDRGIKRKGKKISLSNLGNGKHIFVSFCVDKAGNKSNILRFIWKVDTIVPKTTILRHPKEVTSLTTAIFSFKSSEKNASFNCKVDNEEWKTCSNPFKISSLVDGNHSFFVKSKDKAGNVEKKAVEFKWKVDTVAPTTTLLKYPELITNNKNAKFLFKTSEKSKYSLCKLDKGKWRKCFSPYILTNLKASVHNVFIKSVDFANNIEKTPQIFKWTIDVIPPKTHIKSVQKKICNKNFGEISFVANESIDYFKCKLDKNHFAKCISPFKFSHLKDGKHFFKVFAVDKAKNKELEPQVLTWTVDTVAPNTKIEILGNRLINKPTVRFKLFSNEKNVFYEYKIDEQDSGEITEYQVFSIINTRSPIPIPNAPPEAPSPITIQRTGTLSLKIGSDVEES